MGTFVNRSDAWIRIIGYIYIYIYTPRYERLSIGFNLVNCGTRHPFSSFLTNYTFVVLSTLQKNFCPRCDHSLIGSFFFFFPLSLVLCRGRDEAGAEGAREPRVGIAGAGSGGGRLGAGRPPSTGAEGHSKGRQIRPFPRQMGQRAFQPSLRVGGELLPFLHDYVACLDSLLPYRGYQIVDRYVHIVYCEVYFSRWNELMLLLIGFEFWNEIEKNG